MNKLAARIEKLERDMGVNAEDKLLVVCVSYLAGELTALEAQDGTLIRRGPGESEDDLYSTAKASISGPWAVFTEVRERISQG